MGHWLKLFKVFKKPTQVLVHSVDLGLYTNNNGLRKRRKLDGDGNKHSK